MKVHKVLDHKCNFLGGKDKRHSKETQIMKLLIDVKTVLLMNRPLTVINDNVDFFHCSTNCYYSNVLNNTLS